MASLMLFTGKGGVGKSTVSAATAQQWASQGYRTILVSSDPAHSTDDTLGVSVGLQTTKIGDNFWARNIDAEREAKIFAHSLNEASKDTFEKLMPGVDADLFSDMAMFPGIDEFFALEEISKLVHSTDYDIVVFDTAPTGHTLRALTAPDYIKTFLLKILRMKAKVENLKGLLFRKNDTASKLVSILEAVCEKIDRLKILLRNPDWVTVNLVSIPTEAGFQECYRTIRFLDSQKIKVKNIIINNIVPNFGEQVWEAAATNMATALVKCEYDNQQPYLARYSDVCKLHQIKLVGVSRLPYEPRGPKLKDYANLLWNPKSGLTYDAIYSLTTTPNKVQVKIPFAAVSKWEVSETEIKYQFDEFNFGHGELWYYIPHPPDVEGKPQVRKYKDMVTLSWSQ
jgi:arsenite/tail-anchored protein-transporting ATPase